MQANPASLIELETPKNTLAERILSRGQVDRLLEAAENTPRNHAIVRLLYVSGMRVSEICALTWRDVKERDNGMGQITIYGKGDKTRMVILGTSAFSELVSLRGDAALDSAVFQSRKTHGHLDRRQVERIVTDAATKAGIKVERKGRSIVSPHWMRHAHASHALARHQPVNIVQQTLGHESLATTTKYTKALPDDSSALCLDD